jgi:transcriptional regulator with XRE-family HTH domain
MVDSDGTLGRLVRSSREQLALTLDAAATDAGISTAYLHKLEGDRVKSPSPRVLLRLARTLDVPYRRLMQLAGYVMPEGAEAPPPDTRVARPRVGATNADLAAALERVLERLDDLTRSHLALIDELRALRA